MRIAHTSDWHLGHRRFDRITPTGINVREADVARSFSRLIDALVIVEPDVVLVAGDVFDQVRPSNHAVVHALSETARLRAALPSAAIVMIGGNHCTPKASGTGSILPIFAQHGVRVVDRSVDRIRLGDLSILCAPDAPGVDRTRLEPDAAAQWNVLLFHGEIDGAKQGGAWAKGVTLDALGAPGWDLIAAGHFHDVERVGENAWYSGAIDLVSSNVWAEQKVKGFLVHDLEDDSHEFVELPQSRTVADLPPIDGRSVAAADLDAMIASSLEAIPGGCDGAVIRLVVRDVTRETAHQLDDRALRRFRARALNFALDLRKPERETATIRTRDAAGRKRSLAEIVAERLGARELASDVDRAELLAKAHAYVADAYGAEAAGPPPNEWEQPSEPSTAREAKGEAA
jgi:DNA repair protein SbcD/Mre11